MIFLLLLASLTSNAQLIFNTLEDVPIRSSALNFNALGNGAEYGSKALGRDPDSGCSCREYIRRYVTCFDPENCKKFPKSLKVNENTFKIGTTGITDIVRGDLENLHHVQIMLIEANNNLNRLEPGIFQNMSHLVNMSISYNINLLSLEEGLFEGLINLEELLLAKNGFDETKDFSVALRADTLPKLIKLNLKEMHCPDIGEYDFKSLSGSRLLELNFINSQIEYIHPKAFAPLKYLEILRLGANNINATTLVGLINEMQKLYVPLTTLSLYGLGFRKEMPKPLLEAIATSNITRLSLCKNQFDVISDKSFPFMPNLEYVDLSDVLLSNVTVNAFSGMPNLKTLLLNKNKISSVPQGALLSNLRDLDLSDNSALYTSPAYFTLEKNKFINMTRLWRLNLSNNNLRKIAEETFNGLTHLKVLGLKEANIFLIEDAAFSNLKELTFLNLETNPFPTRNFSKGIFFGLDKLEVLLIGHCGIKSIPGNSSMFEYLPSLKHLDLQGNELKFLSPVILAPLRNLYSINLAENMLVVWQQRMFMLNKMRVLVAYDNKLAYLSRAMLDDFAGLKMIDISRNPFNCECHSFYAMYNLEHVTEIKKILQLVDDRPSFCVYPDEYVNYTIADYFNTIKSDDICKISILDHSLIVIISASILTIIVFAAIFIYVYRWHIRYWIFLTKMALHRNKQFAKRSKLQCYTNYEYDAFVSYSNEDRNFVVRLVAMLENQDPFLRLCVYERDFQIGTVISETVLESVSKSRKTLLIVSDSYIKSQWCRWEVQVAEHHRLFFENEYGECVNDSIVMIKLGNISYANISPMLKYLMKTRIYLQWDPNENKQRVFWEKLRNALAPPKMEVNDHKENV